MALEIAIPGMEMVMASQWIWHHAQIIGDCESQGWRQWRWRDNYGDGIIMFKPYEG